MSQADSQSSVIRVFVSSPGDVEDERKVLEKVADEINGEQRGFRISLDRWEDKPRSIGPGSQAVVDQGTGDYDVYLGIMAHRLGTEYDRYLSGTQKEFRDALERWRTTGRPRILFYFKQQPVNNVFSVDLEQLKRVQEFRESIRKHGLWYEYEGVHGSEKSFQYWARKGLFDAASNLAPRRSAQDARHSLTIRIDNKARIYLDHTGGDVGTVDVDQADRDLIKLFHDFLLTDRIRDIDEVRVLGRFLFRAMFKGEVLDTFNERLDQARREGQPLRLRLRLEENPWLAALPWEYMYYEGSSVAQQFFLAAGTAGTELRLIRRFDQEVAASAVLGSKLRVLIVAADRNGQPDAAEQLRRILSKPELVDRCDVTLEDNPSLERFEKLVAEGFHVVHLVGCRLVQKGEYRIAWREKPAGINGQSINFRPNPPKLLVLQLRCDEAGQPEPEPSNLPAQLIKAGVPMVVTMHPTFAAAFAEKFATEFYSELANDGTSEQAITTVRRLTIHSAERADLRGFGMPVLYLSSDDATVLRSNSGTMPVPPIGASAGGSGSAASITMAAKAAHLGVRTSEPWGGARPPAAFNTSSDESQPRVDSSADLLAPVLNAIRLKGLESARNIEDAGRNEAVRAVAGLNERLTGAQLRSKLEDLLTKSQGKLALVYLAMLDELNNHLLPQ